MINQFMAAFLTGNINMDVVQQDYSDSLDLQIKSEIKDFIGQIKSTKKECEECGFKLKNENSLRNHRNVVHRAKRPFHCSECSATFKSKHHLISHSVIHSDEKPFSCELCDNTFKLSQSKFSHMKTHIKDRKPTHFCPECGKGFLKGQTLKKHIPLHSGLKNFTCVICDKMFSQEINMKTHIATVHANDIPMVSCEICSKSYKKTNINEHVLWHTKERTIPCEICSRKFKTNQGRNLHVETQKIEKGM
jgi:KRAB domain-containing zinc finger protein